MAKVQEKLPTLRDLRVNLGWSTQTLADQAGVSRITVTSAEKGNRVTAKTAKAIIDVLNAHYTASYRVTDIAGLQVK